MKDSAPGYDASTTPPDKTEPRHPIVYCVPGQVVLLAEHQTGLPPAEIVALTAQQIEALRDSARRKPPQLLDRLFEELKTIGANPDRTPSPLLTFGLERAEGRSFSLIVATLAEASLHEDNDQLDRQVAELIEYLDDELLDRSEPPDPRLWLSAATPNWLASSAQGITKGGPGGRPRPESAAPEGLGCRVDDPGTPFRFTLESLREVVGAEADHDVKVAILDTAHPPGRLQEIYNQYRDRHPLICSLLETSDNYGPNSRLQITYAHQLGAQLPGPDEVQIIDHQYPMPDHGLFATGIIHTIAPRARLHLIEVLNEYGVGDMITLAHALDLLAREHDGTPLIVNCSLMLATPLLGHFRVNNKFPLFATDDALRPAQLNTGKTPPTGRDLARDRRLIARMAWPLQWICDALHNHRLRVVASAGNDAPSDTGLGALKRPQARFPAAFRNVIGVGALNKDDQPARYSNLSDRPLTSGIATFGGDVDRDETSPTVGQVTGETGILGVYISDTFPGGEPNENGWARWAGTSFAAPVISGALAAIMGYGTPPGVAVAAIRGAQIGATPDQDEIFSVRQG